MINSIGSILSDKQFEEPPEIQQIKKFVQDTIGMAPAVSVTDDAFVVSIPSAAGAGALRPHINKLQARIKTKKRIILRIR